jgi:TolB-like protein/Flp pilus assembly protein TadD
MKRCPSCQRVYADEALKFCRACGTPLGASTSLAGEGATRVFPTNADAEGATEILGESSARGATSSPLANSAQLTRTLSPARRRRAATRRVIDSLAVLPLANASGNSQSEYLSDGITESIINSLSQLPKLRVVPRATVFRYRGRNVDPLAAGQELNVRAVMTGRLLQVGELLVVSAELVDVALESQIWGEQFRYELADIFALQERISKEISAKLRLRLTGEEKRKLGKRYTENTEAYQLYLKGRYYLNKRTTAGMRQGVENFERAIDLDPAFALAYAGLADAYAFLASSTGEQPPAEFYPKSEAAARRALQLDDSLAEAHTSLGFYRLLYEWDFRGAAREFRRAIELNPNYANAHDGLSFYYKATAQHERAVRACREAQKLDPLSLFAGVSLAWAYYFAHRYEEAIEQNRKVLELDPRFVFAHWNTGMAQSQADRHDEAVKSLRRAVELSEGGLAFKAHLAYACGRAGCGDEARTLLGELEGHAIARYVPAYYFAVAHLGLGETDAAIENLRRAMEERSGFLAYLRVEPMFDPLRDDPRFKELEERVGRAR